MMQGGRRERRVMVGLVHGLSQVNCGRWAVYVCLLAAICLGATAAMATDSSLTMEGCLAELMATESDDVTLGQMKATCREKLSIADSSATPVEERSGSVEERIRADKDNILKPFTVMAHKQNYILLAAHNFAGYSPDEYIEQSGDEGAIPDDTEVQFQLSLKFPLGVDLFDTGTDIYAAYTMRSFWQLYNDDTTPSGRDISAPFRETNHEPEIWLQMHPDFELWGFKTAAAAVGFVHQSNGQSASLSRSWNRVYAQAILEKGNFVLSVKPWYRLQEDGDDDNPDITDFLGHGEIELAYKWRDHVFTLLSRNNLESGFSDGAIQAGWSFPLFGYPYIKGYVQYFSGYGESLIDYDQYVNRIGVGLILTDLL